MGFAHVPIENGFGAVPDFTARHGEPDTAP